MIFIFFLHFYVIAETVDIYSVYSTKHEQLCTNFLLKTKGLYQNGEEIQPFRLSAPGVYELKTESNSSYFFSLIECNAYTWGMSSSNPNRYILSNYDSLRIWVDDASSFENTSDNIPNEVSKQLTSMINSMGVHPSVTISDAMTHEVYQIITDFNFDSKNMWWEAQINFNANFYYEIQFHDLIGFLSPTGQQPISNTNVYPPIPNIFKTEPSENGDPPIKGAVRCPCSPPLNAVINGSQIFISSTNFHNYSILQRLDNHANIVNPIYVDFIDNSIIFIDETGLTIQNFANTSQHFHYSSSNLTKIASPNFCSFSSVWERGQLSSAIGWNEENPSQYIFINLTNNPDFISKHLTQNEKIISITSTLSSKSDFYFILNNTDKNRLYLKKLNIHNEFEESISISIPYESIPLLHWSPFGYIFLLFGNIIQCSSESHFLFSDLQFVNESEREGLIFQDILENSKGEYIVTTKNGEIFFFTIDAPILSKIQTRFNSDTDSVVVNVDGDLFSILTDDGNLLPIPLESEMNILKTQNKFWNHTICPSSVEIIDDIQDGTIIIDKHDILTFSGSVFSHNSQNFVIHVTDNFWTNISSTHEEIIQLQPQTNHFTPLQKHNFNVTLFPKKRGIGKLVIHTTSPSWICGNEMITRNFAIGCPLLKELRIRGGSKITQFYTNPYVKPIFDIYILGSFVEEYKENISVVVNDEIGFVDKGNNVLNATNENQIIFYSFDKEYEITFIVNNSWSYCDLSVKAYITIISPKHTYYYYSVIGICVYFFFMIIYTIIVCCKYKKKEKAE